MPRNGLPNTLLPLSPQPLPPAPPPPSSIVLIDSVLPARTGANEITAQPRWRTAKRTQVRLNDGRFTSRLSLGEGKVGGATWTHTAFHGGRVESIAWNVFNYESEVGEEGGRI